VSPARHALLGALRDWGRGLFSPATRLRERYAAFRALLDADERGLGLITELEEILDGARRADPVRTAWLAGQLVVNVRAMAGGLEELSPEDARGLPEVLDGLSARLAALFTPPPPLHGPLLLPLDAALDAPQLAGGKAANLAAARRAGLDVPPGLVVTARACEHFLAHSDLRPRLDRLLRQADLSRPERLVRLCAGMRALVLTAELPVDLDSALRSAAGSPELSGAAGPEFTGTLAVRSSAVAEDGERSFAGLYVSELDVAPQDLPDAWRRVIAARYRPRAVTYRILCGLRDEETPMAVLVMPMLAARASGVLHTSEARAGTQGQALRIDALDGPGAALMDGSATPRSLLVARRLPAEILEGRADGLDESVLNRLVLAGLVLEARFGRAQEVEWALDAAGRLSILQSRPHHPESGPEAEASGAESPLPEAGLPDLGGRPVLALGLTGVSGGAASGEVRHLRRLEDSLDVPQGAVLAVENLSPSLARCLGRAGAVVAASGGRASHFGSIAREFGLPVVSGLADVFARLAPGQLVTVDADTGRVLAGRDEAALAGAAARRGKARPLCTRCSEAAALLCRLRLTDPSAPGFTPAGCASLHDALRYCHEKAVAAMFRLTDEQGRGLDAARRLVSPLPFALSLLDLGGGLETDGPAAGGLAPGAEATPEQIASTPLRALWQGLASDGETWPADGLSLDLNEFDRISAGIFRKDTVALASYALISADYLRLLARFGYHFAVLDCLCGPRPEANFIGLRFKGGGGLPEQRRLRAEFIGTVLEGLDFSVRLRGDLLEARLLRAEQAAVERRLTTIGRLLVRSLRLDLRLDPREGSGQAERMARDFLRECGHAMPDAEDAHGR